MQVEITKSEMAEIRTGKGKRSTYGGKKTAAPAFILSKKYKTKGNQQTKPFAFTSTKTPFNKSE